MSGSIPDWVQTISLTLHMAATVVWIGGLLFYAIVLYPTLQQDLSNPSYLNLLRKLRRRFQPLAWLSLGILVSTGLFQMGASPEYGGLLSLEGRWAQALFFKHLTVLAMVLTASYQTWFVHPQIERTWVLQAARKDPPTEESEKLLRRQIQLLSFNSLLGMVVLALTALAQSS
jgi:uncharacterized membrane protein